MQRPDLQSLSRWVIVALLALGIAAAVWRLTRPDPAHT